MKKSTGTSLFASLALASVTAAQQGGWLIESSNIVSPSQPTATIEVWAWFDDPTRVRNTFGLGDFDFLAGDGAFSNLQSRLFRFSLGTAVGSGVVGVRVGQIWGFAGITASSQNPILAWSAQWTTTDFTPRAVSLDTLNTTTFNIGINSTHSGMRLLELYPEGFIPGTGMIEVVPSPASAVPLVVVGAVMLRRRR